MILIHSQLCLCMKAAVISVIPMLSSSDRGQIRIFFSNMSSQNGELQQQQMNDSTFLIKILLFFT